MAPQEALIEIRRIGQFVKVSAVDPESLTEVSIQGPAGAGLETLRRAAIAKLNYVIARKAR